MEFKKNIWLLLKKNIVCVRLVFSIGVILVQRKLWKLWIIHSYLHINLSFWSFTSQNLGSFRGSLLCLQPLLLVRIVSWLLFSSVSCYLLTNALLGESIFLLLLPDLLSKTSGILLGSLLRRLLDGLTDFSAFNFFPFFFLRSHEMNILYLTL